MRKRIALFANGWSSEFLQEIGQSLRLVASRSNADIFAFTNYTIHAETDENRIGEFNIFKLPKLKDFDGVIIMASTFNMQIEIDYIRQQALDAGIPAISLEYELDGIDYFGTDDYAGMHALAEHLILDHKVRNIVFIAGIEDHKGSNIRLNAVKDAAASHNISIPEENIIYGNFAALTAARRFEEWLANNGLLPDAIICANDIMAMGICEWLKEHGYNVPQDVKVTGFDCLKAAQNFDPIITSVNREWLSMGTKVMEKLLCKIEGKEVSPFEEITTSLVCGESCGCNDESYYQPAKMHRKTESKKVIDGFYCDQHFRHMYRAMRKSATAEEVHDSISNFFVNEGWLEGNTVLLAMHPNFFVSEGWSSIKMEGFPDKMAIISYVHDKKIEPVTMMDTNDAIFEAANNSDTPGVYIFVPIRVDDVSLGFAVLTKGFSIFQNDILYLWCRHVSQYSEQIKSNAMISKLTKRLEALSVTDSLTGFYNRTGCDTVIYPALITNQQNNGQSVVMFADVDRLKYINDTYGHGNGDLAISLAVNAMNKSLPEGFMIGRYGGDEFLIAGCADKPIDLDALLHQIEANIHTEVAANKLPFELSVSIGAVQVSAGEPLDLNKCIKEADEKMYKIKAVHHAKVVTD